MLCRQSAACNGTVSCYTAFGLFSVLDPLPFFLAFPALLLTIGIPVWLTSSFCLCSISVCTTYFHSLFVHFDLKVTFALHGMLNYLLVASLNRERVVWPCQRLRLRPCDWPQAHHEGMTFRPSPLSAIHPSWRGKQCFRVCKVVWGESSETLL